MSRVSQTESSYPKLQFSDLERLYAIFPDGAIIVLSEATNTQFDKLVESLLVGCHHDLRVEVNAVKQWDAFARFWMMDTLLSRRDGERIKLYSSKEEALLARGRLKRQKKELAA